MEKLTKVFIDITHILKMYKKRYRNVDNTYLLGLWGLTLHLVLLWGVLDANFHSPIIQGLESIPAPKNAPAKRLLLFVADGLRMRTFMEDTPSYLKNIMDKNGAWGISHTRVPTESRPGNVAIAAGLYEDPSAIFKGWKENPVDFDSVFNQSRFTWAWGSPDIIPMFTKGSKRNVFGESYPSEWQDFDALKGEALHLDAWVFNKYNEWLQQEAENVKNTSGVILFFHLLGCDTTGHSKKPHSKEYINNMKYVVQKIEETVQTTENYFLDNKTAYLFTADHGMTDWGSHGSGSADETETPLIAWGAGIETAASRHDVEQADIAPLISSLIGISIPINNEGVLPLQYFQVNNEVYISQVLLNNVKQLAYQIKANRVAVCGKSDDCMDSREVLLNGEIRNIDEMLENGNIKESIRHAVDAAALAKTLLSFYRQYQRHRCLIYLCLMWLAWLISLFYKISGIKRKNVNTRMLYYTNIAFVSLLFLFFIKYKVSGSSDWRLLCYTVFAVASFWLSVRFMFLFSPKLIMQDDRKRSFVEAAGIVLLLGTMFAGLTYRYIFSVGMLFAAIMQRLFMTNTTGLLFWTAIILSIFPLLPVAIPHPQIYLVLGSICITILLVLVQIESKLHRAMEIIRLLITAFVCCELINGRHWISWLILITTPFSIPTYSIKVTERIQAIFWGLFCPYALLSASYEPFFSIVLAIHLLCWVTSNTNIRQEGKNLLSSEDLVKAAFFMLYTLLCFFGTGNMASISSFDPTWTRHFVTIFSPFIMSTLILFKFSIPLVLVGCASHYLGSSKVFLAILLLGDCLSLPLIFQVTPHGSWLEIGSAISRFTIAITLPCLLLLLHYITYPLMKINFKSFQHSTILEKEHIV